MPGKMTRLPRSIRAKFPDAKYVMDATDSVQIHVTQADQKEAKPQDPYDCAMARACVREFKADGVAIGISFSYILKGDTLYRYVTPHTVSREIISFDRHQDFSTGSYRLSKVPPGSRLGKTFKRGTGPRKTKRKDNGVKIPAHFTSRVRELK
jgi:hypothetical protein